MELNVQSGARALIFDLDGTLSDSLPVHMATWNSLGETFGFIFEDRILHEMTGMPTITFAERLVSENNLKISPDELVRLKQQAFWNSVGLVKPIDLVVDIVKSNYGILPMSVGTGASYRSAMLQLDTLGLTRYFDAIVTADDVENHKPYPDTFLKCAQLMGVDPSVCQVFEDGILGMQAARSAGMMVTDVRPFINYGEWALS
jgi:beta-phosphoglucomutase-like phosphatase (HAD superfamily)